jgi:hypothetical protein
MYMEIMSSKEVADWKERVSFLYQSKWLIDNITAILMDMGRDTGIPESTARTKAHAIESWLKFKKEQERIRQERGRDAATGSCPGP